MDNRLLPITLAAALTISSSTALASPRPEFCKVLRGFVESLKPNEKREFSFHTSWGGNFKDSPEPAVVARRCVHNGYEPAKEVCDYLMEHGSAEFAGTNVQGAISCLSKKTRFAPLFQLNSGTFSFSHGSDDRGALVDITFKEDESLGGMVFRLEAEGY